MGGQFNKVWGKLQKLNGGGLYPPHCWSADLWPACWKRAGWMSGGSPREPCALCCACCCAPFQIPRPSCSAPKPCGPSPLCVTPTPCLASPPPPPHPHACLAAVADSISASAVPMPCIRRRGALGERVLFGSEGTRGEGGGGSRGTRHTVKRLRLQSCVRSLAGASIPLSFGGFSEDYVRSTCRCCSKA